MPSSAERKKKDDKEHSRGRKESRDRRRRSRSRGRRSDRRRRRSSSRQNKDHGQNPAAEAAAPGKPVLTPAAAPAESPAAPAPLTTGAGESGKAPAGQVSQEYYEEGVESESKESDAEIPDPGPVQVGLTTARGSGPAAPKAGQIAAVTPTLTKPRGPSPGTERARQRSASVISSSTNADKHSRYTCQVCGRQVGGGDAGAYQHKRSAFHLASWVYWQQNEKKAWKECVTDGARWAKMLSEEGKAGPEDSEAVGLAKKDETRTTPCSKSGPTPPAMERPRPRGRVGLHLIVQGRGWQSAPTDVAGHTQGVIVFQLNLCQKQKTRTKVQVSKKQDTRTKVQVSKKYDPLSETQPGWYQD
eukprot:symbB.v1.2.015286.t1/scaffold1136.1/size135929/14